MASFATHKGLEEFAEIDLVAKFVVFSGRKMALPMNWFFELKLREFSGCSRDSLVK
jgi:hypothetical protein